MANLNEAVQLIRQGHKDEARRLLEPVLKADPKNIQAWGWYVETCSTLEQRLKTLEVCLKVNPGNPQMLQALETLRAKLAGQAPVSRPAPPPPVARNDDIPDWARRPAAPQPEPPRPVTPQPAFNLASVFEFDDADEQVQFQPSAPVETPGQHWQQSRGESKPAFDWEALEKEAAAKTTR
jgi:hypothetical protein